jgi:hypothetical protein
MLEALIHSTDTFCFLVDENYLDFPNHLIAFEEDMFGNLYLIQKDWVFTKTPVDYEEALSLVQNLKNTFIDLY